MTTSKWILTAVLAAGAFMALNGFPWDRTPTPTYQQKAVAAGTEPASGSAVTQVPATVISVVGWSTVNGLNFEELFDVASDSAIVLGTTAPKLVLPIGSWPGPLATAAASGSSLIWNPPSPVTFKNGVFVVGTTTWSGAATAALATTIVYE